jgi:hypothetical protein
MEDVDLRSHLEELRETLSQQKEQFELIKEQIESATEQIQQLDAEIKELHRSRVKRERLTQLENERRQLIQRGGEPLKLFAQICINEKIIEILEVLVGEKSEKPDWLPEHEEKLRCFEYYGLGEIDAIIECMRLSKKFKQFYNNLVLKFCTKKMTNTMIGGSLFTLSLDLLFGLASIIPSAMFHNTFLMKIMIALTVVIPVLVGVILFNSFRAYYGSWYRRRLNILNDYLTKHIEDPEKTIESCGRWYRYMQRVPNAECTKCSYETIEAIEIEAIENEGYRSNDEMTEVPVQQAEQVQ